MKPLPRALASLRSTATASSPGRAECTVGLMPRRKKEIVAIIRRARDERRTSLDLTRCALGELIDDVCTLSDLEELTLTHCHLSTLPEAMRL